jgi:hypothetical protein
MILLSDVQVGERVYLAIAPNFVLSLKPQGSTPRYVLTRRWATRRTPQLSSFYGIVLVNANKQISLRPERRLNLGLVDPPHETELFGYQFIQQARWFTGHFNNPTRQRMVVPGSTFSSRRRIAETRQRLLPEEQPQVVYSLPLYEEVRVG